MHIKIVTALYLLLTSCYTVAMSPDNKDQKNPAGLPASTASTAAAAAAASAPVAEKSSPLITAIREKNIELVAKLIAAGEHKLDAHPNSIPLHVAIQTGNVKIVEMLLEAGVNIEEENISGDRPLAVAAKLGNPEIIRLLINKKASIGPTAPRIHPLLLAIQFKHKDAVAELLKAGCSIEITNPRGNTPLLYAACFATEEITDLIMTYNPNRQAHNMSNQTALIIAASEGNCGALKALIKHGFDINTHNDPFNTVNDLLLRTMVNGHEELAQQLINADFNLHKNALTPYLPTAAVYGLDRTLLALLKAGLQKYINFRFQDNKVLLIGAFSQLPNSSVPHIRRAAQDNSRVVQVLLDAGADPNLQDNNGQTTLMYACEQGQEKAVALLLPVSDLLIKNKAGKSILDICAAAKKNEKTGISPAIIQMVEAENLKRRSPLIQALKEADFERFSGRLLKHKSLKIYDADGNNLLHLAVRDLAHINPDDPGTTPQLIAKNNKLMHIIGLILCFCPELLTKPNKNGITPLQQAVISKPYYAKLLLRIGSGQTASIICEQAPQFSAREPIHNLIKTGQRLETKLLEKIAHHLAFSHKNPATPNDSNFEWQKTVAVVSPDETVQSLIAAYAGHHFFDAPAQSEWDTISHAHKFIVDNYKQEIVAFLDACDTQVAEQYQQKKLFDQYRELQKQGVPWPHAPKFRSRCEKAGFTWSPMLIQRDRIVCDRCEVELAALDERYILEYYHLMCDNLQHKTEFAHILADPRVTLSQKLLYGKSKNILSTIACSRQDDAYTNSKLKEYLGNESNAITLVNEYLVPQETSMSELIATNRQLFGWLLVAQYFDREK